MDQAVATAWPAFPSRVPTICSPEITFSPWRSKQTTGLTLSAVICWVRVGSCLTLSSFFGEPEWEGPPPPPITSLPSREFGTVLSTSQSYHHLSRGAGGWRKPRFLGKLHLPGLPLRVIWGGQLQRITAAAIFLWFPRMRFSVLSPPPPTRTSLKGKKTLFWEAEALSPPHLHPRVEWKH